MNWEARGMKLEISSSDKKGWFSPALFRKNFTRFWPLAALYTFIQFLCLPVELATEVGGTISYGGNASQTVMGDLLGMGILSVPMGAVFGLLTAMALFSYLMNARAAGMLHALPIRREGLFLTNWVSGLCFFALPNALAALAGLGVEAYFGAVQAGLTLRWFALHTVIAMFFFCFAVCCAMFTGHILALPVFYGVLNVLVAGLCGLIGNAMNVLLVGYNGDTLLNTDMARWCTPVWQLYLQVSKATWGEGRVCADSGTLTALGYSVVLGAAFTLIAVVVYQHRQLERAGDVVTVGWVRPVFQYGVGLCVGLVIGTVVYENFFRRQGAWAFVALVAGCAVLGAFVGRMFLKKTLRVFSDGWKGPAVLGLAMLALLGAAHADAFGYQKWDPDPARVKSVSLYGLPAAPYDSGANSYTFTEPELIARTVELHAALAAELPRLQAAQRTGAVYACDEEGYDTAGSTSLYLTYEMTDGQVISREYATLPITTQDLADPDSYAARLQALLNQPQVQRKGYLGWWDEGELTAIDGRVTDLLTGEAGVRDDSGQLTAQQTVRLWTAFLEDLEAGRLHRYLLDDKERSDNCYYSDVIFTLRWDRRDEGQERESDNPTLVVTVQNSATAMMKVLEEEGLAQRLSSRSNEEGIWDGTAVTQAVQ